MKTEIKRIGDTIIVSMGGTLDFETSVPLREELGRVIRQTQRYSNGTGASSGAQGPGDLKIIFNLEDLEFVGSSGISSFVQALREFNAAAPSRPRYCNVKSEFKRVIKAFDEEQAFEFFDNEERARKSFDQ